MNADNVEDSSRKNRGMMKVPSDESKNNQPFTSLSLGATDFVFRKMLEFPWEHAEFSNYEWKTSSHEHEGFKIICNFYHICLK